MCRESPRERRNRRNRHPRASEGLDYGLPVLKHFWLGTGNVILSLYGVGLFDIQEILEVWGYGAKH